MAKSEEGKELTITVALKEVLVRKLEFEMKRQIKS